MRHLGSLTILGMTDCVHGFSDGLCGDCSAARSRSVDLGSATRSSGGYGFALVYAPAFRTDTFVHLNREGEHWKIRHYPSPSTPAVGLAQSAPSSSPKVADLESIELRHEIAYPHSLAPGGVTTKDSRYWFDAITKANAAHADVIGS